MVRRILIIGFGSIGRRHFSVVRSLYPDAEVAVLSQQNPVALKADGVERVFDDIEKAVKFKPELAVIANPATGHIDAGLRLAEEGIHMLIEKPLSHNLDRVPEFLELCEEKNIVVLVGYNLRYLESLKKFRSLIHAGEIGRVYSFRAEVGQYLPSWRPNSDYRDTVSAKKEFGGGVLLELSHEIDYLRWVFGEATVLSSTLSKQSSLEINVEDTALLSLRLQSDDNSSVIGSLNMDFIRQDTTRSCIAIGEKGSLAWNAIEGTISVLRAGEKTEELLHRPSGIGEDSYKAEWKHFTDCIFNANKPLVSGRDAYAVLEVIESARRINTIGADLFNN